MFKLPERLPPSIVLLIGFGLGILSSSAYYWNLASKNDAETLLSDAKTGIILQDKFIQRNIELNKELEIVDEQLTKFADCADRIPADDITNGMQRANNNKERTTSSERLQTMQRTKQDKEYIRRLRDRISKMFTSE